jgi:hypothetical protein
MGLIRERFPLIAEQEGIWDGEYVHLDAEHREIDRHAARLVCRIFDGDREERARLVQSNIYTWPDGTREVRFFEGHLRGDRFWMENERIDGWAAPVDLDETARTLMVSWVRSDDPGFRFYELITMSEDGERKNRTWHGYREGCLFRRTLIDERRVSRDWTPFDTEEFYAHQPRAPLA